MIRDEEKCSTIIIRQHSFPHVRVDSLPSPSVTEYLPKPRSSSVCHYSHKPDLETIVTKRSHRKVSFLITTDGASTPTSHFPSFPIPINVPPSPDPPQPAYPYVQRGSSAPSNNPSAKYFIDSNSKELPVGALKKTSTNPSSSHRSNSNSRNSGKDSNDFHETSSTRRQRHETHAGPAPLAKLWEFLNQHNKRSRSANYAVDVDEASFDYLDDRPSNHFFAFLRCESRSMSTPSLSPQTQQFQPHCGEGTVYSGKRRVSRFINTRRRLAKVGAMIGLSKPAAPSPSSEEYKILDSEIKIEMRKRSLAYFEISCIGRSIGKVYFELFEQVCPKTCENFRGLCTGTYGMSSTGTPLHYKGTQFFRIIPNFIIQGGDVTHDNGTGGECIWAKEQGNPAYSRFFPDESFEIGHTSAGLLSMANEGPNTNQSQFFITCAPCPWLDCRNVVFGKVVKGFDILGAVESMGSVTGIPTHDIRIISCGVCPPNVEIDDDPFDYDAPDIGSVHPTAELRSSNSTELGSTQHNTYKQTERP